MKADKVVMNVFNQGLWRLREESEDVCLGKSGRLHREGEAFELDFEKTKQNSSGPTDGRAFRKSLRTELGAVRIEETLKGVHDLRSLPFSFCNLNAQLSLYCVFLYSVDPS